jgi:hypothetical protein
MQGERTRNKQSKEYRDNLSYNFNARKIYTEQSNYFKIGILNKYIGLQTFMKRIAK